MSKDRRIRVLVNAVAARRGGGAHHLNPFVVGLADDLPDSEIEVLVTSDAPTLASHSRVRWTIVDVPSGITLRRLWSDNVSVPRLARRHDVVISPLNFGPLWCPRPHLLFQRNALYFDPRFRRDQGIWTRVRLSGYRLLAILQSNAASAVLVPSQTMADLLGRYLLRRREIIVSPHQIDVTLCRQLSRRPVVTGAEEWLTNDIRLVYVGSPSAHKGLDTLAETFIATTQAYGGSNVALAVTFDRSDSSVGVSHFVERVSSAGLLEQVSFLGTIPHDDVFPLYRSATLLLQPSVVESFGFPIVEALAVGCPVVCSDLPAFREVAARSDEVRFHSVGDAGRAAELAVWMGRRAASGRETGIVQRGVEPAGASQTSVVGQWVSRSVNSSGVPIPDRRS